MCGRFALSSTDDALARLFQAALANALPPLPNYNICPTTQIHVVFREGDQRRLAPMRWGFVPTWYKSPLDGPLLHNARAEGLAEKPAFREACRQRRCLIPADGFYEWHRPEGREKQPWYIRPAVEGPMVFAGIWQDWHQDGMRFASCAMVTTEAAGKMAEIHHRIPVILQPGDWAKWLGEEGHGAARLMRPAPDDTLRFHKVGKAVNSNRATGPELIEKIEEIET
ncbi:SOS response-associated peptidase [Celeribacter neptunius]|uniref:Abasic site processing protein n=1 Tax=Celeribacter neptunius TaxID=588602 RepID=A0A1I3WBZ0_9RHOB|nr:SOS response-associated peptidase [Celeribacter neptunius]SFK04713.1 Putative SOS response-associated peptidase YedK [Celeribacter neptunius]